MTGHGNLAPATRRMPLDRGNHGLRQALDTAEQRLSAADERLELLRAAAERAGQIRATTEDALPRPGQDDGPNGVISGEIVYRRFQLLDQLGGDRVRRRSVQRHHGMTVAALD